MTGRGLSALRRERQFQKRLAEFIRRHPCQGTEAQSKHWGEQFERWLFEECSPEEHERALNLYELHIKNEAASRGER